MELRHLRYFVAMADADGLTTAAPTHHETETARPYCRNKAAGWGRTRRLHASTIVQGEEHRSLAPNTQSR